MTILAESEARRLAKATAAARCPACNAPLPVGWLRGMANRLAAAHGRPGAIGQVRNPAGRPKRAASCPEKRP